MAIIEKYDELIRRNPDITKKLLEDFHNEMLHTWKTDMIKSYQEGFNGACEVLSKANDSVQKEAFRHIKD